MFDRYRTLPGRIFIGCLIALLALGFLGTRYPIPLWLGWPVLVVGLGAILWSFVIGLISVFRRSKN